MFLKGVTPISTSMLVRAMGWLCGALAVFSPWAALDAQTNPSAASVDIRQTVARLGGAHNDDFADARILAKTPAESARALIASLHTIANPENAKRIQDKPAVTHAIAVLQALRYITAMDFCATTQWKFGDSREERNRRYWLYFDNPQCVAFVALWPSHGRFFFAPLDAQQNIIADWQSWYAHDGHSYHYPSPPDDPEKSLLCWQEAAGSYSPPRPDAEPCSRPLQHVLR